MWGRLESILKPLYQWYQCSTLILRIFKKKTKNCIFLDLPDWVHWLSFLQNCIREILCQNLSLTKKYISSEQIMWTVMGILEFHFCFGKQKTCNHLHVILSTFTVICFLIMVLFFVYICHWLKKITSFQGGLLK